MTADDIIAHLDLAPHPEGGWYRETWRGPGDKRPSATAITFLLKVGEKSHWHRVDAAEIWHFYAGAPLELRLAATSAGPAVTQILGPNLLSQSPQIIVPADHWQTARTLGEWTLVGCTVSPGFQFDGFELASPGFDIP
jgi:uncharacterized protein